MDAWRGVSGVDWQHMSTLYVVALWLAADVKEGDVAVFNVGSDPLHAWEPKLCFEGVTAWFEL